MKDPERDHGIENEPHLRDGPARPDPSEEKADRTLRHQAPDPDRHEAEHSVYNEPSLCAAATPAPDRPTYETWLARRIAATKPGQGLWVAIVVMALGGPFAILGALMSGGGGALGAIVWGPVAEEVMKVAILVTIVELRPFTFTSRAEIHLAAAGGGLGFAVVENLIYLNIYVPDPSASLALWRWTICVALHVGCSLVASLGVARMWKRSITERARPRMGDAAGFLLAAILIHGGYNAFAMVLGWAGFDF